MSIAQIERWLVGLAGGIGYLHDRGIVHRDVNPGNIFWDQGSVKLGDIGLSKFMTPSHRSAHTESVGTVYYMAPEVSYGKYGYEVDIYSVGVMLYEMLSGQLPFDGQSTGEILMKHLSEPPNLNIVPAPFRPMLAAALEKDPKKRTGTMAKLLADFRQAQSGGPIPVAPSRQSGFAVYPNVQAGGQASASNAAAETPQVAAATRALPVGTVATNFGKVWGADPVDVQLFINRLTRVGVIGAKGLGIGYLILLTGAITWPILPVVAIAFLISPALRYKLTHHWIPAVMTAIGEPDAWKARSTPERVAQVTAPAAPAPVPVAVPVRQVSSPRPAPSTPAPEIRLDRSSQRLAELCSSLSWATVLTVLFAGGTGFLSPLFGDAGSLHPDLGKLGVFTFTTLLAVWSILIVTKFTTSNRISNQRRRVINLAAGVVVGSAAWWLSRLLMVDLSIGSMEYNAMVQAIGRQPLVVDREPTWLAFAIFFGLLFGARRWWWHADAHRPAMFRVSSVLGTVIVAAILPVAFAFPWDWAVTWAAVMSCVVQLSAAWTPEVLRMQPGRHDLRGST